MQLELAAIYLDETQLRYILSVEKRFSQENFNFNFVYYDSENEFASHHNIKTYPTFVLLKNDRVCAIIEGKLEFSDLKERLSSINYVRNGKV